MFVLRCIFESWTLSNSLLNNGLFWYQLVCLTRANWFIDRLVDIWLLEWWFFLRLWRFLDDVKYPTRANTLLVYDIGFIVRGICQSTLWVLTLLYCTIANMVGTRMRKRLGCITFLCCWITARLLECTRNNKPIESRAVVVSLWVIVRVLVNISCQLALLYTHY